MVIKGKISDSFGSLDGSTIVLMRNGSRTNVAVVSDSTGSFQIDNEEIKDDDIFEVRFLGYLTQEISAKDLSNASIMMAEDVEQLDEVIITASVGQKPTPTTPELQKNKIVWYKSPIVLIPTIALLTLGAVLLIVNKLDK